MSSKINLQTCEYACKSSIFQDNQLISVYKYKEAIPLEKRDENGSTYEVFAHPNSQKAFEDVNTRYDLSRELDPIILNVYSLQKAGYTRPEICKKLHINACLYNHYNSCLKKALQTYSL